MSVSFIFTHFAWPSRSRPPLFLLLLYSVFSPRLFKPSPLHSSYLPYTLYTSIPYTTLIMSVDCLINYFTVPSLARVYSCHKSRASDSFDSTRSRNANFFYILFFYLILNCQTTAYSVYFSVYILSLINYYYYNYFFLLSIFFVVKLFFFSYPPITEKNLWGKKK